MCPFNIPQLWIRLDLPGTPPKRDNQLFRSPFRADNGPGCFLDRGLMGYNDFAVGINTGPYGFIALGLRLPHTWEERKRNPWIRFRIDQWLQSQGVNTNARPTNARPTNVHPFPVQPFRPDIKKPRDMRFVQGLVEPSDRAVTALASLRRLPVEGVRFAVSRGLVVFGYLGERKKENAYWGLYDPLAEAMSVRRMDGEPWPATRCSAPRKAHTPSGWGGAKFFGIHHLSNRTHVAWVEGVPDYLAAHCRILQTGYPPDKVGVVAAQVAHSKISPEELAALKGRSITCYLQNDVPSYRSYHVWREALGSIPAYFEACLLPLKLNGRDIKDVNDWMSVPENVTHFERQVA